MAKTKKSAEKLPPLPNEETFLPEKFHIIVKDADTGKLLGDYTTGIAIIAAVAENLPVGNNVPTNVLWLGGPENVNVLLGLVNSVVGQYLLKSFNLEDTVKINKRKGKSN